MTKLRFGLLLPTYKLLYYHAMAIQSTTPFDTPWKEIIEKHFRPFLKFFFPNVQKRIDWTKGYEFLDQELQKVVRSANTGRRFADKLVKVFQKNGEPLILYIHIEIQGQYDKHFGMRMFIYHYRFFDRYKQPILSLAVLGDDRPDWYPTEYGYTVAGCQLKFRFPVVKLLDYRTQWAELEKSKNPFAMVVRIHLKGLETRRSPTQRLYWKQKLYKALYEEANYTRQQILDLFWFLDWVFALPDPLELQFQQFTFHYEEENKVRYVTSIERMALERGHKEGLEQGLEQGLHLGMLKKSQEAIMEILQERFKRLPNTLVNALQQIDDTTRLSQLLRQAVSVESLKGFQQLVGKSV
jgi:hypothetical protein